jgi:hypothetical protein
MKKFSDKINEELLWSKSKTKEEPIQFKKVNKNLIKHYCMNLYENNFMELHPDEKSQYNFEYYKVKSITKIESSKYEIIIQAYDKLKKPSEELKYLLEC